MDIQKIVQLRLLKQDFKKLYFSENYSLKFLDKNNYKNYINDLLYVSSLMKQDFEWIGIPNESTLHRRFIHNSHCLLSYFNNQLIGWVWSNYNVTPLWEESIQELSDGEIYGGGAFLSRKIKRPPNSGVVFYNMWFEYWLNEMNNNVIYQYSDDWNRASSIMSYKSGFKKFNFIKENTNAREY